MSDRSRRMAPVMLAVLFPLAACDVATEPAPAPLDAGTSAEAAAPDSNGQLFVPLLSIAGMGFQSSEGSCFLSDSEGEDPDSWIRVTPDAVITMEHWVIQDGVILGEYMGDPLDGRGHGVMNAHYRRDGTFTGSSMTINGTLEDGRSVKCRLNMDRNGTVTHGFIEIGDG